jgi:hypothetical protein
MKLNAAQPKYSTCDPELLAINMAVNHIRRMLEVRHLIIFADYKPITYIYHQKRD